jgi:hypothetical protein
MKMTERTVKLEKVEPGGAVEVVKDGSDVKIKEELAETSP